MSGKKERHAKTSRFLYVRSTLLPVTDRNSAIVARSSVLP
jgi:hypothetical protein